MATDLMKVAKERKIKYFLISYVDLFGVLRAKLSPAAAIGAMQRDGAGFAGFATWLDMTPAHPALFARPDPDSLSQRPWKPEVGWLASDLWMDGKEVADSPRAILKRKIAEAEKKGIRMKSGVECEYFLITPDGKQIADGADTQDKPCYDQQALMRRYDVITDICDSMLALGWKPYQHDHEDANGQFEKHGMRATFMPKPFSNLTGNGCHAHVSFWDKTGKTNLFGDAKGELGLSKTAYKALGGILHSADALCSFFNPPVTSYKRINAPRTTSGATWSPSSITWTGNNRTHMIRVTDAGRYEIRLADGATNPYLLQEGILSAGLDGIANDRDPGKRLDINMYTEGHTVKGAKKLPLNLLDALRLTDKSKSEREQFGDSFIDSYIKMKTEEWNSFTKHLTEWERQNTLDC